VTGGAFFEQFIEDYYAECDEHLAASRRVLLALEGHATDSAPEPRLLREMFRSLHTLKGLSGMVGDPAAESIAHALEGSLRAAERAEAPLDTAFVDALFSGVELLERCIATRRTGGASPDAGVAVEALERTMPRGADAAVGAPTRGAPTRGPPAKGPPAVAVADAGAPGPEDGEAGAVVYHFEFVPSVELTARGVGVDAVRTRLRALGTLLDAKPRMLGGGVAFDLWVAVEPGRAPDDAWEADGLRWTAAAPAAPVAPGPPASAPDLVDPTVGAGTREPAPTGAPPDALPGTPAVAPPGSAVVRVDLARLDGVMRLVGELVVSRSRLDELLRRAGDDVAGVRDALEETNEAMERQLRRLRESVMRIRLVPIGEVFERLRFAARDAIRESGKQVTLAFEGQTTEIDKLVVDRMLEPLLHLVRNAVSHGIERPAERLARGKSADGRLTLRAHAAGDRILVEVEDDGAGIDARRVATRARERGLLAPDETLTPDRLLDVLCAPGFSTRDEADMTSGRGVGMDVVRSTVRALAGELSLDSTPGRGTRFVVELPLTLMILDALLVDVGGQQMAVPQPTLREILQVAASAIVRFENNDVIAYRDGVLPLVSLARLFGLPESRPASVYVLVVGTDATPMGLVVDRLLGLREIVVHPLADPLVSVPGVSGATELGDGRVSLILDAAALLRLAHERRERRPRVPSLVT
jgi:two-component system chemotaxis sensor kinase CheA